MKDILGKDVKVGDVVVFNIPHYKEVSLGTVIKITPKGVKVHYDRIYFSTKTHEMFVYEKQFVIVTELLEAR